MERTTATDVNRAADISVLWNEDGHILLVDYLKKRAGLSERETALVNEIIKGVGELICRIKWYQGYSHKNDDKREYRRLLSVKLRCLGLDEYEPIYFRQRYEEDVISFPVTKDMIEDGFAGGLIKITDGPGQGEQSVWIRDRCFLLDKDTAHKSPALRVRESIEKAFLNGRTEDYAYADAVLHSGGRAYVHDYTDKANWGTAYTAGRDYKSTPYSETRFEIEHVRGVKGQVREHWVLYDLITGEQRTGKTFTECRKLAQDLASEFSRYEPYAYSPGTDAYYRGQKVRIISLKKDGDGNTLALCAGACCVDSFINISELYLNEKDAVLPGEKKEEEIKGNVGIN